MGTLAKKASRTSTQKPQEPILLLKVRGPGVRSGHIPVSDLIRICQVAQIALTRQAVALGGECTLELIGIKNVSTTVEIGFASRTSFCADIVYEIAGALVSIANGEERPIDAGVLQGVYEFASLVPSKTISEIDWICPGTGRRKRIVASFNGAVQERVGACLSRNFSARSSIFDIVYEIACELVSIANREGLIDAGVLEDPCKFASVIPSKTISEIDWICRTGGRKRIVTPFAATVRERIAARLSGNFFAGSSIAELAAVQNVSPLSNVSTLSGGFPVEEDVDEFLEDIYSARK